MVGDRNAVRVGVILSAGGLRGVAHLGVLRQLLRHGVPLDIIVGASAGAIVAAYYAAVGLSVEEMISDAPTFRGRHIILHGLSLRAPGALRPLLARFCGVIPGRLRQLDSGSFENLHHGVQGLGIVCHDLVTNRPLYFSTGRQHMVTLSEVVKASASIPGVIPSRVVRRGGQSFYLTDGGLSDSLPVEFARSQGLAATGLIVSDCRSIARPVPAGKNTVYLRPDLGDVGMLRAPRATLLEAVKRGEEAVTEEIVQQIRAWWS